MSTGTIDRDRQQPEQERRSRVAPPEKRSSALLRLARTIGNGAFTEFLTPARVQRKKVAEQRSADVEHASELVHQVLHSTGQPLDPGTRTTMESRLGHDLSQVRVHTEDQAQESAGILDADAYTVGQHIAFAKGKLQPNSNDGRQLLAHELAHTIQQRNSAACVQDLKVSSHEDPIEREADLTSRSGATGFRPQLKTPLMLSRQARQPAEGATATSGSASQPTTAAGAAGSEEDRVWILPPGVRAGSVPIYDSEETHAVIGFKYSAGGFWQVFDLEGKLVEIGEIGLEHPLIDPIDIFAGLLAGGLFSGGRAAARGLSAAAERTAAETAAETGVRAVLRSLGRATLSAIRSTYRALRFRGTLNFTETTAARMADPARRVPQYILRLAIRFGTRTADPEGVPGAFRYLITLFRNGRPYTLEVVLREADQTVLHFLYR